MNLGIGQDGLPPLHVPMRFFVTAALFGVLAGVLWCADGEAAFGSRWAPSMLGAVHLLTLGFFTMVMFGALFQVVPVLGGDPVPRAVAVANLVHPSLLLGAGSLGFGLWRGQVDWLVLALCLLGLAFAVFVPAVGWSLLRRSAVALRPVRLAVAAFALTVGLGAMLGAAIAWPELGWPFRAWTNAHAAAGGLGWGLLLVVAVSHQVVPMFHVTPAFPARAVRCVPPAIAGGLGLVLLPWPVAQGLGTLVAAAAGFWHIGATLWLLANRRRRRADPAVLGWQVGLPCIAAALLLAVADLLGPLAPVQLALGAAREPLLGLLFGFAGLGTIVVGMLTKIVPFLAFLHLQRRCLPSPIAMTALPSMDSILSRRAAFTQVLVHAAASAGVVTAAVWPAAGWVAGAAVVVSFGLVGGNLLAAWWRYRSGVRAIDRAIAAG
jgi:hypothetical protein